MSTTSAYESRPAAMACETGAATSAGAAARGVAASPDQAAPPSRPATPRPATQVRAPRGVRLMNLFMCVTPLLLNFAARSIRVLVPFDETDAFSALSAALHR